MIILRNRYNSSIEPVIKLLFFIFPEAKFNSPSKTVINKREGVIEKAIENDIRRRARSQKKNILYINCSMYLFSVTQSILLGYYNEQQEKHIQELISVSEITI